MLTFGAYVTKTLFGPYFAFLKGLNNYTTFETLYLGVLSVSLATAPCTLLQHVEEFEAWQVSMPYSS